MWAGVISSVEISSRSLGLFCGFFVSQGRSSPASCLLMSAGSSVRKRMRPWRHTVCERFSIFLCRRASITEFARLDKRVARPHLFYADEFARRGAQGRALTAKDAQKIYLAPSEWYEGLIIP